MCFSFLFSFCILHVTVSKIVVDKFFFFLQSSEESILKEIRDVKNQLHALMEKLDKLHS